MGILGIHMNIFKRILSIFKGFLVDLSVVRIKQTTKDFLILLPCSIIAIILRVYENDVYPYNFDESTIAYLASTIKHLPISLRDINNSATSSEMPLYAIMIALLFRVLGESEGVGRGLSALFSVMSMIIIYYLLKRYHGRVAGVVALILLIADPVFLRYSRVAIPYTAMVFFVLSSFWFLLTSSGSRLKLAISGLLMGIAFSLKIIAIFHFLTCIIYFLVRKAAEKSRINIKERIFDISIFASSFAVPPLLFSCILVGDIFFYLKAIPIILTIPGLQARIGEVSLINNLLYSLKNVIFYEHHGLLILAGIVLFFLLLLPASKKLIKKYLEMPLDEKQINNFERLLIIWIPVNLMIASIGAVRYWAITLSISIMILLSFLFSYALATFRRNFHPKTQELRKSITSLLIIIAVILGAVEQYFYLPTFYKQYLYDDYWSIPTYRDVGRYIAMNSQCGDYVVTNTHAPVLRYYSGREVFYYFGFDPERQIVFLHMYYSYGIINAKYYVDLHSFISSVKFIVLQSPPPHVPGTSIAHAYVSVSKEFLAVVNRFYRLDKVFYYEERPYTFVYRRLDKPSLSIEYTKSADWEASDLLRIIVVHHSENKSMTEVVYSATLPFNRQTEWGSSQIETSHHGIVLRTASASGVTSIGLSTTFLNIPCDEKFFMTWSWCVVTNTTDVSADVSVLVDGSWHPVASPSKLNEPEVRTLSTMDLCSILGRKPHVIQAVQFTIYAFQGSKAELRIYNFSIKGDYTGIELNGALREEKYAKFPTNVSLSIPIHKQELISINFHVDLAILRSSSSLWLRLWYDSRNPSVYIIIKELELSFIEHKRTIINYTLPSGWPIPFAGTVTDIPIYVLYFPFELSNDRSLILKASLGIIEKKSERELTTLLITIPSENFTITLRDWP